MKIALCVDNNGGMLFNNRRQSRDRILIEDLLNTAQGKVRISPFSADLFDESKVICSDDFLEIADENDVCFVEDCELSCFNDKISQVILYCWNRDYPSDFSTDIDLDKFKLKSSVEFVGSSHDKITKEIYIK